MSLRRIGPFVLIMLVGVFACVFAIQQQHSATNVLVAQMQSLKQESAEQALDHWQRRVRFFLERAVQDETLLNQLGSGQQSEIVHKIAQAASVLKFQSVMLHDRSGNTLYLSDAPSRPGELYGTSDFLARQYSVKPQPVAEMRLREKPTLLIAQNIVQNGETRAVLILAYALDESFLKQLSDETRAPLRLRWKDGRELALTDEGDVLPLRWPDGLNLDAELKLHVPAELDVEPSSASLIVVIVIVLLLGAAAIWLDGQHAREQEAQLDKVVSVLRAADKSQSTLHSLVQGGGASGRVAAALIDAMHQQMERRQLLETQLSKLQQQLDGTQEQIRMALRERDLALTAPRTKSEFLSRMGDEITTPMNSMMSMLSILNEHSLGAQEKELLLIALRSAKTLIENLNNIMDFSKLDANLLKLNKQPFPVKGLVQSVVNDYQHHAEAKNLKLTWNVNVDVPDTVINDANRVHQLLQNLVGNAVRFTKEGEVGVFVDIWERNNQKLLRFTVSDTGVGLPKDAVATLFESLESRSKLTNASFAGRLRLIVAKMLAECMGGEIGVTSEPGKGSRFWFTVAME